jgi:ATP-dependent protease ClpP protease subunit
MNDLADGLSFVLSQQNIAKININTEITSEIANDFIDLLLGLEHINDDNSIEAVVISISSPGGLVAEGFNMYSTLKMSTLPIYIINTGIVASIAGIIFLGVKKENRFSFENSLFMIHNAHGGDDQLVLEKINRCLESILGTAITSTYLQSLMDSETWMDISEQVTNNIVSYNNIIKVNDEFDISKLLNINTEKNLFNIYNRIIKNNEEEMSKNILEKLKALKNSIMNTQEESINNEQEVIANATEDVENEELVNTEEAIIESDISENLINKVEEADALEAVIEEEAIIEEPIVKSEIEILLQELSEIKMKLELRENELAEIENSKKLNIKLEFLKENKIEATEDLLSLDINKLKNIIGSVKVNKAAPILFSNKSGDISTVPVWENMNDIEKNDLLKNNIEMFNKSFKNKK